jgi:uncharacterized DUF497 family protein
MEFVWSNKNISHISEHGISPQEAEFIAENAKAPYPQMVGDDKRFVVGTLPDGRHIQVIYVPSRSVPGAAYVIHSRPLSDVEKRKFRRRKR